MEQLEKKIISWYKEFKEPKMSFVKKGIRPTKDWNKILIIFFILIVIIGSLEFYFYLRVDDGTFFSIPEEELASEVKINNNLLDKIIKDSTSREEKLSQIRLDKKAPANPSI